MPDRKIHEFVTEILLGEKFSDVHSAIDGPSSSSGPSHRRFFHEPETAAWIGHEIAGEDGAIAAILHILTDEAWDEDMEEISEIGKVLKSSEASSEEEEKSKDRWIEELRKSFSES